MSASHRLGHVALRVQDMERAKAFYTALGLRLTWDARELEPGVYYVRGPFTASGGTGEFAGASGRGTYRTLIDTNTGQVTSQFKGRVE